MREIVFVFKFYCYFKPRKFFSDILPPIRCFNKKRYDHLVLITVNFTKKLYNRFCKIICYLKFVYINATALVYKCNGEENKTLDKNIGLLRVSQIDE